MTSSLRMTSAELMCFNMSLSGSTIDEIADDTHRESPRTIQTHHQLPTMHKMPSLLDESTCEECNKHVLEDHKEEGDSARVGTTTTCSDSGRSSSSYEEAIALEVGHSAHEYLEECFYTEVSILDREKFNAIPEVVKSDFAITCHLGKGSFSDVFEVASNIGRPGSKMPKKPLLGNSPLGRRRSSRARRSTLSNSITVATLSRPSRQIENRPIYAMKCLRPGIRSDADQFTIGAEDLVHETAILCNLDHDNIIKVHGRASGNLTDAFVLNDGYFILLDKLSETLQDRMDAWRRPKSVCQLEQAKVAHSIADAVTYLHSKKIVFRDLKPANVGFDSNGVLKMFDFGFATGLPERDASMNPEGYLFDRCGTPRYMAPEVGLSLGYGLPADVYSFGILLWEIHALTKPFAMITSAEEFDQCVFIDGERPPVESQWSMIMRALMRSCWSDIPSKRPTILDVKSTLASAISNSDGSEKKSGNTARFGMMYRRTSGN